MPSQHTNRELWLSFTAIVCATLAYLLVMAWQEGVPRASELFGHSIGIMGFIMMLMTETLYSLRKRSRSARWGRMSSWLEFHIFTGVVGPYLVLLHSSWKFNGLAGVVMLMTVMIVASGFIGRYIYTAVPRTADGTVMEATQIEEQIGIIQEQMTTQTPEADSTSQSQEKQLKQLTKRHNQLRRQLSSLATARKMLSLWHSIHIPIGMVLFTAAFIHVVAALYYATLMR